MTLAAEYIMPLPCALYWAGWATPAGDSDGPAIPWMGRFCHTRLPFHTMGKYTPAGAIAVPTL